MQLDSFIPSFNTRSNIYTSLCTVWYIVCTFSLYNYHRDGANEILRLHVIVIEDQLFDLSLEISPIIGKEA